MHTDFLAKAEEAGFENGRNRVVHTACVRVHFGPNWDFGHKRYRIGRIWAPWMFTIIPPNSHLSFGTEASPAAHCDASGVGSSRIPDVATLSINDEANALEVAPPPAEAEATAVTAATAVKPRARPPQ